MAPTPPADPRGDQRNEPFDTPSIDAIVGMTLPHVAALESSPSSPGWTLAGMRFVVITSIGRKSGLPRKTPLPYWLDRDGHRIVVASFAGALHNPAWFHNLADKSVNPTIQVQDRELVYRSDAQVLDGDDYTAIWEELTSDRPFYLDYQAKVTRRIPLIRLPE